MVIPPVSTFNSPIWLTLKPGKNEWLSMVDYNNLNAVGIPIKAPVPISLKLKTKGN